MTTGKKAGSSYGITVPSGGSATFNFKSRKWHLVAPSGGSGNTHAIAGALVGAKPKPAPASAYELLPGNLVPDISQALIDAAACRPACVTAMPYWIRFSCDIVVDMRPEADGKMNAAGIHDNAVGSPSHVSSSMHYAMPGAMGATDRILLLHRIAALTIRHAGNCRDNWLNIRDATYLGLVRTDIEIWNGTATLHDLRDRHRAGSTAFPGTEFNVALSACDGADHPAGLPEVKAYANALAGLDAALGRLVSAYEGAVPNTAK